MTLCRLDNQTKNQTMKYEYHEYWVLLITWLTPFLQNRRASQSVGASPWQGLET